MNTATDAARHTRSRLLGLEVAIAKSNEEFGAARRFISACHQYALSGGKRADLLQGLGALGSVESLTKAAATSINDNALWSSQPGLDLSTAWLESVQGQSILDLLSLYAVPFPRASQRGFVASGASADVAAEGAAKVVRRLTLTEVVPEVKKVVSLIVMTQELLRQSGALTLVENEMKRVLLGALNAAVIAAFPDPVVIPGSGSATEDLQNGIAAAAPASAYIAYVGRTALAELIVAGDGRIGATGGTWSAGVHVVASTQAEASAGGSMVIISASNVGLWTDALTISASEYGTVEMLDSPTQSSTVPTASSVVSLFQTGSTGFLVERSFSIASSAPIVVIE